MSSWKRLLLDHLELLLTAVGLIVILAAPLVFPASDSWKIYAVTAITVGCLHGLLFWLVRRRQRTVRRQALAQIQLMLTDRVPNHLTVIMAASAEMPESCERAVESIQAEALEIAALVQCLGEESLSAWQERYRPALHDLANGRG